MQIISTIQNHIYEIRNERVMLDFDIAAMYEVEVKVFNQAVKRNSKRFPEDFMFQLTKLEYEELMSQIEASDSGSLRSQNVTLKGGRGQHRKFMPYAFTEQGIAMLSGILTSDKAIQMSVEIIRAFVYDLENALDENF